jgi:hypothetical protein
MNQFPTATHLASCVGLCPGNNESAGKRRSGKTRKGNDILKTTLIECSKSASYQKTTYLTMNWGEIFLNNNKKNEIGQKFVKRLENLGYLVTAEAI